MTAATFDTNILELAIGVSSIAGLLVQLLLLRRSHQSILALEGFTNGRRKIARFHLAGGWLLLACHAVFVYFAVRLVTTMDPPAYSVELVINLILFVFVPVALMVLGFIQLWLWNSLAKT